MGQLIEVPAFLEPPQPCLACAHASDWHRTGDGRCTHDILDREHGSWMRCSCEGFRA